MELMDIDGWKLCSEEIKVDREITKELIDKINQVN